MKPLRRLLFSKGVLATVAGILAGASMAVTVSVAGPSGVISACAQKKGGDLRLVSSPKKCRSTERVVQWNQQGPIGAPGQVGAQGPPGANGLDGAQGEQGPAGVVAEPELEPLPYDSSLLMMEIDGTVILGFVSLAGCTIDIDVALYRECIVVAQPSLTLLEWHHSALTGEGPRRNVRFTLLDELGDPRWALLAPDSFLTSFRLPDMDAADASARFLRLSFAPGSLEIDPAPDPSEAPGEGASALAGNRFSLTIEDIDTSVTIRLSSLTMRVPKTPTGPDADGFATFEPGTPTFSDWTLTIPAGSSGDTTAQQLNDWVQNVVAGNPDARAGSITYFASNFAVVMTADLGGLVPQTGLDPFGSSSARSIRFSVDSFDVS